MADEYIKRENAKIILQRAWIEDPFRRQEAFDELNSIPPADVAEVVRCKDCKYHATGADYTDDFGEPLDKAMMCLGIRYGGVDPDWFCEHGARMDGGT